jgi:molybdopterin converting factor small subunit
MRSVPAIVCVSPTRVPSANPNAVRVELQLHATLAPFLPPTARDGAAILELNDGATVADVVGRLGIPAALSRIVLVNGHDVEDTAGLRDGDVVDIFPPLAGGAAGGLHSEGSGSV